MPEIDQTAITDLLSNNVEDVLATLDDFGQSDLEAALLAEQSGQKRKGVTDGLNKKLDQLKQIDAGAATEANADVVKKTDDKKTDDKKAPVKKAQFKNPIDGLGKSLKPKALLKKSQGKKGPVDGLGRPL